MADRTPDDERNLRDWLGNSSALLDRIGALFEQVEKLQRTDEGYQILYNQLREAAILLDVQFRNPPDTATEQALASYWQAEGPWVEGDMNRMRKALRAGFAAITAAVKAMRLERGVREFTAAEVEAGIDALRTVAKPGSSLHNSAEMVVRRILKAVSGAKHGGP